MGAFNNRSASHHFYIVGSQGASAGFTLDGFHPNVTGKVNLHIDNLIPSFLRRAQFCPDEYQDETNHQADKPDENPTGRSLRAEGSQDEQESENDKYPRGDKRNDSSCTHSSSKILLIFCNTILA
jgi:hypothetical protein